MLEIQHTFIVLEVNIFENKLQNSLEIKILQQTFIEFVDTFVLDLLISC